ncbi:putative S-adenosyl-L-methionine-dependent methyltransferase [Blattamonas nauphoetae]|uniref:S-adenosyl-L-methionine-dependent methyltransferase n=1 Tax=Blattamonas nauphoetae TaxID=2049346 RepID=A0ABQ9XYW4_9EUKA|nr:putative S-adenosyl-L-methionine-dependent methyltransferase [Blattamonas nauphoetae]
MTRPEHIAPPELYYNEVEAKKYTQNTRVIHIQRKITKRAIELLALPKNKPLLLLDIGCGSGLSGQELRKMRHVEWIGLDISASMLAIAKERDVGGDLCRSDLGEGIPFRPNTIDGAISISTVQWLFNADFKDAQPFQRLKLFFQTLNHCLRRGGRAVIQFYPENGHQLEEMQRCATQAGFGGGLLCDYPNSTRQKKWYFVLFAGTAKIDPIAMPQALMAGEDQNDSDTDSSDDSDEEEEEEESGDGMILDSNSDDEDESDAEGPIEKKKTSVIQSNVQFEWKREKRSQRDRRKKQKNLKQKVMEQKERQQRQGKDVRRNTKYTGRKRKSGW